MSEESDYLQNLDPVAAYKMAQQIANQRVASPEEQTANGWSNLHSLLSILPVVGNAVSAYDAGNSAGDTANSIGKGDWWGAAGNAGLTGLGVLGAVAGLPTGKAAGRAAEGAASRVNIFAGPMAKTADKEALARAQTMEAQGADRDTIRQATGWFQDVDKKWRFEIPDDAAKLSGVSEGVNKRFTGLEHPAFNEAYGATPEVRGTFGPQAKTSGSYRPGYITAQGKTEGTATAVALHELQHHIQDIEGFAGGGNPQSALQSQEARDAVQAMYAKLKASGGDPTDALGIARARVGFDRYNRLAGEVEARNVERRRLMTPAERETTSPWATQPVPDERKILSFGNENSAVFRPLAKDDPLAEAARQLRMQDMQPATVYGKTGAIISPAGDVRGEILDAPMKLKGGFSPGDKAPLSDVIDHPDFFNVFPSMRSLPVEFNMSASGEARRPNFRTNPNTGGLEYSLVPNTDAKGQLAKLLQYKASELTQMPSAMRHGYAAVDSDIQHTMGQAVAATGADPAARGAFIDRIAKAQNDLRDMRDALGSKISSEHQSKLSVGNLDARAAMHRARVPEDVSRYPYAHSMFREALPLPPRGMPTNKVEDFINDWYTYGGGRPAPKQGK